MRILSCLCLASATAAVGSAPLAFGSPLQQLNYSSDFEELDALNANALADSDWKVFINVYESGTDQLLYGFGPFPAPNTGMGYCSIAVGEGSPSQGNQQLLTYSEYNNDDHANGHTIETTVFQQQTIGPEDLGKTYTFRFDARPEDLGGTSQAAAFVRIYDGDSFRLDSHVDTDTTLLPQQWSNRSVSIDIPPDSVGDVLQFGFRTEARNYEPSGMLYDNLHFGEATSLGLPYCFSSVNSTGSAAWIQATGSVGVSANSLVLTAAPVPDQQSGIFYFGEAKLNSPFGNGTRCVGGAEVWRLPIEATSAGALVHRVDNNAPPFGAVTLVPGARWNFQAWFRDPGSGGASFNLSDAVELIFVP